MNMPVEQMEDLNAWFEQRWAENLQEHEASKTPGMAIIATKGTMDMAYPPFILASTAAALGWDVSTIKALDCSSWSLQKDFLSNTLMVP